MAAGPLPNTGCEKRWGVALVSRQDSVCTSRELCLLPSHFGDCDLGQDAERTGKNNGSKTWLLQRAPGKTDKTEVQRREGRPWEGWSRTLCKKAHPAMPYVSEEVMTFWECIFLSNITAETIHFLPAYVVTQILLWKIHLYSFWFWFSLNNSVNSSVATPLHL